MDIDEFPEITPVSFFDLKIDLLSLKGDRLTASHILPQFEELTYLETFADVYAGWNDEGLKFRFDVHKPFEGCDYPDYQKGDVIELFINTRGSYQTRYYNRFCHHFLIFPTKLNGIHALEMTKFRGEDRHDLCLPEQIEVSTELKSKSYEVTIFLPKVILNGFDPKESKSLCLDYRCLRTQGQPQTLFHIPKQVSDFSPMLWPKIELVE